MLSLKIHKTRGEIMVAACDLEILGRKFSEGDRRIEVYSSFYKERVIGEEELGNFLLNATIANLVGQRAVGKAIELGYVDEGRVLKIGETVHAQFATIQK